MCKIFFCYHTFDKFKILYYDYTNIPFTYKRHNSVVIFLKNHGYKAGAGSHHIGQFFINCLPPFRRAFVSKYHYFPYTIIAYGLTINHFLFTIFHCILSLNTEVLLAFSSSECIGNVPYNLLFIFQCTK